MNWFDLICLTLVGIYAMVLFQVGIVTLVLFKELSQQELENTRKHVFGLRYTGAALYGWITLAIVALAGKEIPYSFGFAVIMGWLEFLACGFMMRITFFPSPPKLELEPKDESPFS